MIAFKGLNVFLQVILIILLLLQNIIVDQCQTFWTFLSFW